MIYGVTGMPLAGKTTVAEIIQSKGFELVDMGDIVRKEMEKRDIPAGKTGDFVNQQREEHGMDAIAKLTVPYLEEIESSDIVITGMRSLEEKDLFEEELGDKVEIIAVWASPGTRKKRKQERMREEDIQGDNFYERDKRELENGVGDLMALSKNIILNEKISVEKLEEEVNNLVR